MKRLLLRPLNYSKVRLSYLRLRFMSKASRFFKELTRENFGPDHALGGFVLPGGLAAWRRIRPLSAICPVEFRQISPRHQRLPISNPSILINDRGSVFLTATEVNRLIDYKWGRRPKFTSGQTFSSNILLWRGHLNALESDLVSVSLQSLPEKTNPSNDARLFWANKSPWLIWNDQIDHDFTALTGLAIEPLEKSLHSDYKPAAAYPSPFDQPVEKNWMPVSEPERLAPLFVYSCQPLVVLSSQEKGLEITQAADVPGFSGLEHLKGGTPLVPIGEDQYLCVTHVTKLKPTRHYHHHVVLFKFVGETLTLVSHSLPFVFRENFHVEFAAGLSLIGDQAFISFGDSDKEAWLAITSVSALIQLAHEVKQGVTET